MTAAIHHSASFVMASPLGDLKITMHDDALAGICYLQSRKGAGKNSSKSLGSGAVHIESQLRGYFEDPDWCFDLELKMCGTAFQQRVWKWLTRIPSGQTLTYGEVARRLKSGPRAVGGACRNNPVPIVVPCHRVIAANAVGGYCGNMQGRMLRAKLWLLQHEHFDEEDK